MGPLTLASGRDKVERLIADAIEQGARLVTGGRRPEGRNSGYFLEPTVLGDVPAHAAIMSGHRPVEPSHGSSRDCQAGTTGDFP
jgi:succinate-semialdehyde dehydrogenase/glutarate-semialdehyde dehydrogenase